MTTPKPARPDTLQAIVAEMRGPWLPNVDVSQTLVRAWAIRIEAIAASAPQADALLARLLSAADRTCGNTLLGETSDLALAHLLMDAHDALAASAQVREVEPADEGEYGCPFHFPDCHSVEDFDTACRGCKAAYFTEEVATAAEEAAAEPVPVAQDFDKFSLWTHHELVTHVRQQQATIADHARRDEEAEAARERAYDNRDMALQAAEHEKNRADALEASLAACRALVPKWRAEDSIMPSEHFADELGNALHQEPKP